MSQLQITNAGIDYRNAVFAGEEVQNITHFIFAKVPGQDASAPIDPNTALPADILHAQPVKAVSKVDGNAIVMSAVLGYDIGDFEYNWYGVVATKGNNQQVLIAVVTTETQTKTKTEGAITGNYSVKSVVWRSQNIADDLNITLAALPWQVQEGEFVSRADFDAHNHDTRYVKKAQVLTDVPENALFTDTNTWRDVLNTLTSSAKDKSLSANQGRILKELADSKLDENGTAKNTEKLNNKSADSYVTTDEAQTVSGKKTFTSEIGISNSAAIKFDPATDSIVFMFD